MDKLLRPERLDADPKTHATNEWLHWKKTFENFMKVLPEKDLDKLGLLINHVSPNLFECIENCTDYNSAIATLEKLFVKPVNEVYARHQLATRRQQPSETLDEYLLSLRILSKNCNFKDVSATVSRDEYIRDAFITGISSPQIRQRLLENNTLDLTTMFDQARALEAAARSCESYNNGLSFSNAAMSDAKSFQPPVPCEDLSNPDANPHFSAAVPQHTARPVSSCFFCGNKRHLRSRCPARNATCLKCNKKGHFAKVCRGNNATVTTSAMCQQSSQLASILAGTHNCLKSASAMVSINKGIQVDALFDSGSSESFIHPRVVRKTNLPILPSSNSVTMAASSFSTAVRGYCLIDLTYQGKTYKDLRVSVMDDLCVDLILGLDFQSRHKSITFQYGGPEPPISLCGLSTLNIDPPSPFCNLSDDCRPIATKSRYYSREDLDFISKEVDRMLHEGIIEPSKSPWRAQVVVTKDENHKKRLVIDYSQTINRYTLLDAFPLPRINDQINAIAQYRVFNTIDLRSAYHQVPLKIQDRPYTAFEANGFLFHFTRLPFGLTNGVACFQREMMNFIKEENLKAVFPYLDNITICGKDQKDHDENLKRFLDAAERKNITYNEDKSIFSTRRLSILGYVVGEGEIRPDPERLRPLRDLPIPHDSKSLSRCLGLFSYYSKWIPRFSDKIKAITS